jgi:hypothetical protein
VTVDVLTRLPISEPDPNTVYRFSNPWGLALSEDGSVLWAVDASTNALLRIDSETGRWQRVMRFPPMPNPGPGRTSSDRRGADECTDLWERTTREFSDGLPFVPGTARVLAIDPAQRSSQPFMSVSPPWWMCCGGTGALRGRNSSRWSSVRTKVRNQLRRAGSCASTRRQQRLSQPTCGRPSAWRWMKQSGILYVLELSGRILRLRHQK